MSDIEIKTANIDGKLIAYSSKTAFFVQIGKGKSAYKTKYSFEGNLGRALFYYNAINIGNGYKKRLYMPSAKNSTIAKMSA
jgi:hypothetical protein